jgi:hypothetical protein
MADGVGDDARVHHFTFHNCVGKEWLDSDANQFGGIAGVIYDGNLYQP